MILAVDTATEMLGIALHDGDRILWECERFARMRHTVELSVAVEEMLRGTDIDRNDIRAIGVAQGPGSFTALRIGIAFAEGFAVPKSLPVFGVPTFDILAWAQPARNSPLVTVIHAGRGRIAAQAYRCEKGVWAQQGEPWVASWEDLMKKLEPDTFVCGEVDKTGRAVLARRRDIEVAAPSQGLRRAGVLADIVHLRRQQHKGPVPPVRPIYLRTAADPGSDHG